MYINHFLFVLNYAPTFDSNRKDWSDGSKDGNRESRSNSSDDGNKEGWSDGSDESNREGLVLMIVVKKTEVIVIWW